MRAEEEKGAEKRRNGEERGRQRRGGEREEERGILEPEVTDYIRVLGIDRFHSGVNGRF